MSHKICITKDISLIDDTVSKYSHDDYRISIFTLITQNHTEITKILRFRRIFTKLQSHTQKCSQEI